MCIRDSHEFSQTVVDGVRLIGDPNSLFMVYESKEPVGYIPYKLNYYIDTSYTCLLYTSRCV